MKAKSLLLIGCLFFSSDIFAEQAVSSKILVQGTSSWDGSRFEYLKGTAELTVQKIAIKAETHTVSLAVHCHSMPLAAYVLKGSVKVIKPSGESQQFNQGDAFIEVMNQWHQGIFVEDSELIVFYAGSKGTSLSFKQVNNAPFVEGCR